MEMSIEQKAIRKMTTEEKQLLLKDICARLPYGIKVKNVKNNFDISTFNHNIEEIKILIEEYDIKPYLRPMSSMTGEELKWYYNKLTTIEESRIRRQKHIEELNDWLNEHHFDYRGLIEKGLALEALEGMYNF